MPQHAIRLLISGRVQGVGFRAAAQRKAREHGLAGSVRNLPDGRVELIAEGMPEALALLTTWCHQGPPLAVVEQVLVEDRALHGYSAFDVVR